MKLSTKAISLFALFAAMAVMTSCVSKKKYEEAMTRAAAEKSALESSLASAQEENAKLNDQISELEKNLGMKSDEIVGLSQQIKDGNDKIQNLQNAISEAFTTYDPNDVMVEERNGKLYITLNNAILFESGRDRLTGESEEVIAKLSDVFKKNTGLSFLVEGHTDNEPVVIHKRKYKDNWSLSIARSLNVVRELEKNGVSADRMTASGKGETMPIASNDTDEGRMKNRRTEFIVVPKVEGLYKMYKDGFGESGSSN